MIDFCKYIQDIEKNPRAIAPTLTVGEFIALREHVWACQRCWDSATRALSTAKPNELIPPMQGLN